MLVGGKADIHRVDFRIAKRRFDGPMFAHRGKVQTLARTAEVALNGAQVSCQLAFVRTHYGGQPRARCVLPCLGVGTAHEAQP